MPFRFAIKTEAFMLWKDGENGRVFSLCKEIHESRIRFLCGRDSPCLCRSLLVCFYHVASRMIDFCIADSEGYPTEYCYKAKKNDK